MVLLFLQSNSKKINGVLGVWVLGLCLTDRLGETTNPRSQTQPAKPKPEPLFFYWAKLIGALLNRKLINCCKMADEEQPSWLYEDGSRYFRMPL